jgi:hypothetical protein
MNSVGYRGVSVSLGDVAVIAGVLTGGYLLYRSGKYISGQVNLVENTISDIFSSPSHFIQDTGNVLNTQVTGAEKYWNTQVTGAENFLGSVVTRIKNLFGWKT